MRARAAYRFDDQMPGRITHAIRTRADDETASVLDGARRRTRLRIIAGRPATGVRGCELWVPPPSTHGHQELDRVLVALCLCTNIAKLRLLILPLGIEQTDDARTAAAVVDALQTYGLRGHG